jgi:hypothetical protein
MSRRKQQDPVDRLVDGYNELTSAERYAFACAIRASDKAKGLTVAAEQPRKPGRPAGSKNRPAAEAFGAAAAPQRTAAQEAGL